MREDFSRKGAKPQSATAFLKVSLCDFAPFSEKSSLPKGRQKAIILAVLLIDTIWGAA
jgi:hypothetical protein